MGATQRQRVVSMGERDRRFPYGCHESEDWRMNIFFVTIGLRDEIDVIRKIKPRHILCSYWYFSKTSMSAFIDALGYKPKILLDSGAYSAVQVLASGLIFIRANITHPVGGNIHRGTTTREDET